MVGMLQHHGYAAYLTSESDGLEPIEAVGASVRGSRNLLFCQPDGSQPRIFPTCSSATSWWIHCRA